MIANFPGSAGEAPAGARVLENPRPLSFAANMNAGVAATSGELVLVANPDAVPEAGAVATLRDFMAAHPRCGVAGPQLTDPDGALAAVPAALPDRSRHARPAHAAPAAAAAARAAARPLPPRRAADRARAGGLDARRLPAAPPRRCSTSSAASMRASACTARTSTSATARRRPAGSAGTCRARSSATIGSARPTSASSRDERSGTGAASRASCAST